MPYGITRPWWIIILETGILKSMFLKDVLVFWFKFHWILILRVLLIISQHWFCQWLDTHKVASHYLNQYSNEQIDGLIQERCNSIAYVLELCVSCTNPSKWSMIPLDSMWHHKVTMGFIFQLFVILFVLNKSDLSFQLCTSLQGRDNRSPSLTPRNLVIISFSAVSAHHEG